MIALVPYVLANEAYYSDPSSYNFEYAVADPITGDTKSQSETRTGDTVQGVYQLLEPDGTYRTVTYVADAVHGFRANVQKSGTPTTAIKSAAVVPVVPPASKPYYPYYPAHPAPAPSPYVTKYVAAPLPPPPPAAAASYSYPYYTPSAAPIPYSYPYYQSQYYSGYYPYYYPYYKM